MHDVDEITMKREMLEDGYELLTMRIYSCGYTFDIEMFSEQKENISLDLRGIGLGAYTVQ